MDHVSQRGDLDGLRAEVARIESEPSFDFAAAEATKAAKIIPENIPANDSDYAGTMQLSDDGGQLEPQPIPDELPPTVDQFDENATSRAGIKQDACEDGRQPFGQWLLAQKDRKGWIADLAKWAKTDIRFPKHGSPDDVRKRLTEVRAEGDAFEALDDAEMDWLAY